MTPPREHDDDDQPADQFDRLIKALEGFGQQRGNGDGTIAIRRGNMLLLVLACAASGNLGQLGEITGIIPPRAEAAVNNEQLHQMERTVDRMEVTVQELGRRVERLENGRTGYNGPRGIPGASLANPTTAPGRASTFAPDDMAAAAAPAENVN